MLVKTSVPSLASDLDALTMSTHLSLTGNDRMSVIPYRTEVRILDSLIALVVDGSLLFSGSLASVACATTFLSCSCQSPLLVVEPTVYPSTTPIRQACHKIFRELKVVSSAPESMALTTVVVNRLFWFLTEDATRSSCPSTPPHLQFSRLLSQPGS